MKLPKTFIPEKNLEEKTKCLLEAKPLQKTEEEKYGNLYTELKNDFPNFADYLITLYPDVEICKVKQLPSSFPSNYDKDVEWHFFSPSFPPTLKVRVGQIKRYIQERGTDTSEYGYKAEIFVRNQKCILKYRKGYHTFDSVNVIITTNDPLRLDKNKDTPFP